MRQNIRELRSQLPTSQHYQTAISTLHNLLKNNLYHYQKIAIYLSYNGELDTHKIIKFLIQHNREVYLPIIHQNKLQFGKISPYYKLNRFGIKEPTRTKILTAKQLNLIIMPLVGFDEKCNRLGMGGGFYDRTLSFRHKQKYYKFPKLYGLAFNFQKMKITPNSWDVKLDKIIVGKPLLKL